MRRNPEITLPQTGYMERLFLAAEQLRGAIKSVEEYSLNGRIAPGSAETLSWLRGQARNIRAQLDDPDLIHC